MVASMKTLPEIHNGLEKMQGSLAVELLILARNSMAAEQNERLYELWFDLCCCTDSLGQEIKRMETPCQKQKQHDAWLSSALGATRSSSYRQSGQDGLLDA